MEQLEAIYWLAIINQANNQDKEAMELLQQENELRTEMGNPTVEQDLTEIVKRAAPQMEMSDFGTLTEAELKDLLMKGKVVYRNPKV